MKTSQTYGGIFPETWKLLNLLMALSVSTASVERLFVEMNLTYVAAYQTQTLNI